MAEFIVDILRMNPLGAPYLRTERYDTREDALRFIEGLTEDRQVIEIIVRMNEGRRSTILETWKRTSAGNCRTARQTMLPTSPSCSGTTLPAGGNAGL